MLVNGNKNQGQIKFRVEPPSDVQTFIKIKKDFKFQKGEVVGLAAVVGIPPDDIMHYAHATLSRMNRAIYAFLMLFQQIYGHLSGEDPRLVDAFERALEQEFRDDLLFPAICG